jgi:hypothetical protein
MDTVVTIEYSTVQYSTNESGKIQFNQAIKITVLRSCVVSTYCTVLIPPCSDEIPSPYPVMNQRTRPGPEVLAWSIICSSAADLADITSWSVSASACTNRGTVTASVAPARAQISPPASTKQEGMLIKWSLTGRIRPGGVGVVCFHQVAELPPYLEVECLNHTVWYPVRYLVLSSVDCATWIKNAAPVSRSTTRATSQKPPIRSHQL